MLGVGTYYEIGWMMAVASAYLAGGQSAVYIRMHFPVVTVPSGSSAPKFH